MKHFIYIEHNLNDHINDEEKNSFITQLINNKGLGKEYKKYIKLENFLNEQEERIEDIIKELTDFIFDVNLSYDEFVRTDDIFSTVQDQETSKLIRSIIESNRPPNTPEKKGWFRAAAVLTILLYVLNQDTASLVINTNIKNMVNAIVKMDFSALT